MDVRQAFVARIEQLHGKKLRRFIASRLRSGSADAADIAQEVFLRLLRIDTHESIRSSEAYLFTVAFHVLHQHVLRNAAIPEAVEISTLVEEMESNRRTDPTAQAETQQYLDSLESALSQLSPKARAVLLLHRRDGYTLEEIAAQLGFSRGMAAKYLRQSLLHCRKRLSEVEGTP